MTRDDIVKWAQEANLPPCHTTHPKALERFAKLVAEYEREECAKAAEEWLHGEWHNQGVVAALMIRERGAP